MNTPSAPVTAVPAVIASIWSTTYAFISLMMTLFGAPEAEMDLPYGHMAQNTGYAMIAQRYASVHGYDAAALARIAVDQRFNACHNPQAMFYGQPITVDDVLASRMVAERPWFGFGPGTYVFQYSPFQKSDELTLISTFAGDLGDAHSEYFSAM
jgi:hypothetical protein